MNAMNRDRSTELEQQEQWDFDRAELVGPSKSVGRTVVSVSIPREDFAVISKYAAKLGLRTSEFFRQVALNHIKRPARVVVFSATGGAGSLIFTSAPVPKTDVWVQVLQELNQPRLPEQVGLSF